MTTPTDAPHAGTCPLTREQVLDRYFLEHRGKLLDLAAFLDRVDRAQPDVSPAAQHDPRVAALLNAIDLLVDGQPSRARRVQLALSDPTQTPIDAAHTKAACGVPLSEHAHSDQKVDEVEGLT